MNSLWTGFLFGFGVGGGGGWVSGEGKENVRERTGGGGGGRDSGKIRHGGLQSAVVLCDYTLL